MLRIPHHGFRIVLCVRGMSWFLCLFSKQLIVSLGYCVKWIIHLNYDNRKLYFSCSGHRVFEQTLLEAYPTVAVYQTQDITFLLKEATLFILHIGNADKCNLNLCQILGPESKYHLRFYRWVKVKVTGINVGSKKDVCFYYNFQ